MTAAFIRFSSIYPLLGEVSVTIEDCFAALAMTATFIRFSSIYPLLGEVSVTIEDCFAALAMTVTFSKFTSIVLQVPCSAKYGDFA
jgi:hypothetical protein